MSALLRVPELQKYELLEEVGHGGMATVFRARDRRLQREVAVKLIHPHLRDRHEIGERFVREATTVAKLRHPNIVEVYDVSEAEDESRYLVVELVVGKTLRDLLRERGPMPPEVAVAITLEVASGLEHAHRQGVIHRDVKPENVLLSIPPVDDPEGGGVRVKLTDFGIAKVLGAHGVTSTGEVLGSPAHMAPEQIEGGAVDVRSDVFGLGVMLYECLVGKLPFAGQYPAQVLRRVLSGEFVPPEREQPKVGSAYSRIVERAMARNAEDRFPDVESLSRALEQELTAVGLVEPKALLAWVADPFCFDEALVVERLIERGTAASLAGQISVAADCFGRALSYRPGDRELLRKVSSLSRTRSRRALLAWCGGGAVALAVAAFATTRLAGSTAALGGASPEAHQPPPSQPLAASPAPGRPSPAEPAAGERAAAPARSPGDLGAGDPGAGDEPSSNEAEPRPLASSRSPAPPPHPGEPTRAAGRDPSVSAAEPPRRRKASPARRSASEKKAPARSKPARQGEGAGDDGPGGALREVVVRITGATGGTLRIDGTPRQWFGDVKHELSPGPHDFEFVSPDPSCCVTTRRTVVIDAGEGVQHVVGKVPFLDATLRVDSDSRVGELGVLSCPTLFSGERHFPGEVRVSMSRQKMSTTCTLRSETPGAAPQSRRVRLRAGRTTVIPWP